MPTREAVFGEQLPERALLQDVVQSEGKHGWILGGFLSRGDPQCPDQYSPKKVSHHLTTIMYNTS
jgi:hypothetical protein